MYHARSMSYGVTKLDGCDRSESLMTFLRKQIGVRSKRHSVVLRRDDGSPDWDGMILFGMGVRKEADSGHLWKQN